MIRKIKFFITHPKYLMLHLLDMNIGRLLPDSLFIKLKFKLLTGTKLNLDKPSTFSEKLQWLKLHDRNPEYTKLVDKYEVRKFVAEAIGEQYLMPVLGLWGNPDDIDFKALPESFVLKCTHGSSANIICRDKRKLDTEAVRTQLSLWLNYNWYWFGREWPYKNVKPRIIAQTYMEERETKFDGEILSLTDYKFYCFNGKPEYCQVILDRFTNEIIEFYDMYWNFMEFGGLYTELELLNNPIVNRTSLKRPDKYEEMIEIAKKLSRDYPYVRVDLYYIQNKIYFGELTFYPLSGFGTFDPPEWNYKIGSMIKSI